MLTGRAIPPACDRSISWLFSVRAVGGTGTIDDSTKSFRTISSMSVTSSISATRSIGSVLESSLTEVGISSIGDIRSDITSTGFGWCDSD